MSNKVLYGTAATAVVIAAATLTLSPSIAQNTSSASVDTTAAVKAANWADNVTITVNEAENTFRFESNGIPSHGFADQYLIPIGQPGEPLAGKPASEFSIANSATDFPQSPIDTTITTLPTYSDAITETSLGSIGVAITGALLFNDYEDPQRSVVAKDDQVIHDHVAFLDECNGHTLADGTTYHYHGIPTCIINTLYEADEHSTMLGVLSDGFPVYGNHDQAGAVVTNVDLDECSGHFGPTPEFPEGIYHYHLTADEAPYMVDCYHGEIEVVANAGGPDGGPGGPDGGRPDFAAIAIELGVSERDLMDALGTSMPPNFDAAAEALGISADTLHNAMPGPPQ